MVWITATLNYIPVKFTSNWWNFKLTVHFKHEMIGIWQRFQRNFKQECIPVGCIPATCRPYAGVCFPGGSGLGGVCSQGVSGQGGGVCSWGGVWSEVGCLLLGGGIPACTEADPPVNRMTDKCKNITLATTSLRPVIKWNFELTVFELTVPDL